jgi:hypothetical protein
VPHPFAKTAPHPFTETLLEKENMSFRGAKPAVGGRSDEESAFALSASGRRTPAQDLRAFPRLLRVPALFAGKPGIFFLESSLSSPFDCSTFNFSTSFFLTPLTLSSDGLFDNGLLGDLT